MTRFHVAFALALLMTTADMPNAAAVDPKQAAALKESQVYQTLTNLLQTSPIKAAAMIEPLKEKYPKLKTPLGIMYVTGEGGVKKNQKEGLRLLDEAARKHGDPRARLLLGDL